ncbi:MAG: ubiquinol-cytochrome C chaperone family protein [Rhodospirillales bacterium]
MSLLKRLLGKKSFSDEGLTLYRLTVEQGRRPIFYLDLGVPDSVDGRFDLLALHVFLVMRRLKDQGAEAEALGQDLSEIFFADMDLNLRELGASDIGVGKRVKRMIEGFYGRALAYDAALRLGPEAPAEAEGSDLEAVLRRNLYATTAVAAPCVTAMAAYIRLVDATLQNQDWRRLSHGEIRFPDPLPPVEEGSNLA